MDRACDYEWLQMCQSRSSCEDDQTFEAEGWRLRRLIVPRQCHRKEHRAGTRLEFPQAAAQLVWTSVNVAQPAQHSSGSRLRQPSRFAVVAVRPANVPVPPVAPTLMVRLVSGLSAAGNDFCVMLSVLCDNGRSVRSEKKNEKRDRIPTVHIAQVAAEEVDERAGHV